MTTPDPEPQECIYAERVTRAAAGWDFSEAVTALIMEGRMKEAVLLHVYETDEMHDREWENMIALISHRVSHRRPSAASRPDKPAHKPQAQ